MLGPVSSPRLTTTSYVVLGLLERCQPATPYDLKRFAQVSVLHFWSVPHTQLYTECARLAASGHLSERREAEGRRRRLYTLTELGAQALGTWRAQTSGELYQLRDEGLLKLFFGADPAALAETQLAAHQRRLEAYEEILAAVDSDARGGMLLALEAGIGHEREFVRFWSGLRAFEYAHAGGSSDA
jgi:PadR family transcriptional regulator AphA